VQRHPVLEEGRQERRPERVAEVVRLPRLLLAHSQDPVADVAVLADDVGVGVVHVVVRVAPLIGGAGGVPLELLARELRVVHPLVLAVHHVVADLHVVEDLGEREGRGPGEPEGRHDAGPEQAAAGDLEPALGADDAADVVGVALAAGGEDAAADCVELGAELLELLRRQAVGVGGEALDGGERGRLRGGGKCGGHQCLSWKEFKARR
jgi:hypothetical protein